MKDQLLVDWLFFEKVEWLKFIKKNWRINFCKKLSTLKIFNCIAKKIDKKNNSEKNFKPK